jgi:hypothetical protein
MSLENLEILFKIVWESRLKNLKWETILSKYKNNDDPDEFLQIGKFAMKVFVNTPFHFNNPPSIYIKLETIIYLITLANMKKDYLMRNLMYIISTEKESSPKEE